MRDHVTFTLSLQVNALFGDMLDALRDARDAQAKIGNPDAAHALHTIIVLAQAGVTYLDTSTTQPMIPVR